MTFFVAVHISGTGNEDLNKKLTFSLKDRSRIWVKGTLIDLEFDKRYIDKSRVGSNGY